MIFVVGFNLHTHIKCTCAYRTELGISGTSLKINYVVLVNGYKVHFYVSNNYLIIFGA